jgi:tRNA-dihydrouridine synthase B
MPERRTGKHIVPPKALVVAPMAGITDPPYRLLAREKGADLAYTEMVSAKGLLVQGNKGSSRILEVYPHEGPLMGQLYGSDPAVLAEAASLVQELGFDGVDINAGCPVRKVVKKGGGAALLREPTKLRAILKRLRDALHITLGIKIRSGWDEDSVNCLGIVEMAEDCGVDLVVIHPRLRSQKFGGEADWGLIRRAKERTRLTVGGVGEIRGSSSGRGGLSMRDSISLPLRGMRESDASTGTWTCSCRETAYPWGLFSSSNIWGGILRASPWRPSFGGE